MKDDRLYIQHIQDAIDKIEVLIHNYMGVDLSAVWERPRQDYLS